MFHVFSCKLLSKAYRGSLKQFVSHCLSLGKGSTGETFAHGIEYVMRHRPDMLIWENVDALLDDPDANEDSNLKVLQQSMAELEYEILILRLNACQFALPQHRVRVVIIGHWIASPMLGDMSGFPSKLTCCIQGHCISGPPDARDAILKHDCPEVKESLNKAQDREESLANACHANWPDLHQRFLRGQGIRWSTLQPTPTNVLSPHFDRLSLRERERL